MTEDEFIQSYIPMVDFIAQILGKSSEVVLNDVRHLDHSIVAIRNNTISHRQIGDPASDLALRTIKQGKKEQRDFIANYTGVSEDKVTLRSSTYFLRYAGKIVAMICINTDESSLNRLQDALATALNNFRPPVAPLDEVAQAGASQSSNPVEVERLISSKENLAEHIVREYAEAQHTTFDHLNADDRIKCVHLLYQQGFFQLKNGISDTAAALGTSEGTVYRYVAKVKQHSEEPE